MGNFFAVSEAGSLAIHSMIMIANEEGVPVRIKDVAGAFGFSEAHLAKVLGRLVKSGIISATRGPSGGYRLAKSPGDISLLDILRAIEGEPSRNPCMFRIPLCDGAGCALGSFFKGLSHQVSEKLATTSLADIKYYKTFEHLIHERD